MNYLLGIYVKYGGDIHKTFTRSFGLYETTFELIEAWRSEDFTIKILKILINHNFDVNRVMSSNNMTPLYYAITFKRWKVADFLIDHGAILIKFEGVTPKLPRFCTREACPQNELTFANIFCKALQKTISYYHFIFAFFVKENLISRKQFENFQ